MIEVNGLTFGYGATTILKGITFQLAKGEVVGLVGPNGAGKSTVIKLLTRVLKASAGEVLVEGERVGALSRLELARRLAVVPQTGDLAQDFSAYELVLMGRTPHIGFLSTETQQDLDITEAAMRRTETWGLRERLVGELSGGERQRVLLARALVQEPDYLLLDEPTNHLDLRYQTEVLRFTRQEVAGGLGALVVLHDLNLAARVCERILVLHEGRIVAHGDPQSVLSETLIHEVYGAKVALFAQPGTDIPVIMPQL